MIDGKQFYQFDFRFEAKNKKGIDPFLKMHDIFCPIKM